MATLWGQFKPWLLAKHSAALGRLYNDAEIVVERNNHGGTVLRALDAEERYRNIFEDNDEKPGWLNVEPTRTRALDTLEQAVREEHFQTPDRDVIGEMRTFVITKNGRAEAQKGAHDDLVLMAAIGWDVICRTVKQKRTDFSGLVL